MRIWGRFIFSDRLPRMKIVHVVSSLQVGGMEHFVVRMAAAQCRAGHQASIFALKDGALTEEASRSGVPVTLLRGGSKVTRTLHAARVFGALRPDIIHAHNQTSLHYAVLGKRLCRAPVLMTNHGQGLGSARTPGPSEWAGTDAVVAVSNAVADRMDRQLLGGKLRTIYNGVEFSLPGRDRPATRAELGISETRVIATIVARLDHLKGHENLINALAALQPKNLPLTVLVAGDGAKRAEREEQAAALGLTAEQIRFLGFRSDIPDLLAASDIFVLPSLTEGLPLSVLEAMSHGLPTVATTVGGIPELVTHEVHGLLVPSQAEAALAEALETLTRSADKRAMFGAAAKQKTLTEFSYGKMMAEYEALYNAL
jgi:L-malate glycosyltransferase